MLRTTALSYQFPSSDSPAIGPLDLAFEPGSLTLITGPTGSGKSTVLRLLSGLLQRHGQGGVAGRVHVDDEDPALMTPKERVQRVAFVSQDPADQIVSGTVADEVAFAPESAGWSEGAVHNAVTHWLKRVGLDVPLERNPTQLSGGQQQRLVVAGGLSAGAKIVLLDEPRNIFRLSLAEAA